MENLDSVPQDDLLVWINNNVDRLAELIVCNGWEDPSVCELLEQAFRLTGDREAARTILRCKIREKSI